MEALVIALVSKYPIISSILMVMGALRILLKPTFTYLHQVAAATETKRDDEVLDQVEKSKAYGFVVFLLDWFASVKIQKP